MKNVKIYSICPLDGIYTTSVSGQFACSFGLTQEALDALDMRLNYKLGASWEVIIPEELTDEDVEGGILGFDFNGEANRHIYNDISGIKSQLV